MPSLIQQVFSGSSRTKRVLFYFLAGSRLKLSCLSYMPLARGCSEESLTCLEVRAGQWKHTVDADTYRHVGK
jgi:hypothetical protein